MTPSTHRKEMDVLPRELVVEIIVRLPAVDVATGIGSIDKRHREMVSDPFVWRLLLRRDVPEGGDRTDEVKMAMKEMRGPGDFDRALYSVCMRRRCVPVSVRWDEEVTESLIGCVPLTASLGWEDVRRRLARVAWRSGLLQSVDDGHLISHFSLLSLVTDGQVSALCQALKRCYPWHPTKIRFSGVQEQCLTSDRIGRRRLDSVDYIRISFTEKSANL